MLSAALVLKLVTLRMDFIYSELKRGLCCALTHVCTSFFASVREFMHFIACRHSGPHNAIYYVVFYVICDPGLQNRKTGQFFKIEMYA